VAPPPGPGAGPVASGAGSGCLIAAVGLVAAIALVPYVFAIAIFGLLHPVVIAPALAVVFGVLAWIAVKRDMSARGFLRMLGALVFGLASLALFGLAALEVGLIFLFGTIWTLGGHDPSEAPVGDVWAQVGMLAAGGAVAWLICASIAGLEVLRPWRRRAAGEPR
jgi:hypothetical protein